MNSRFPRRQRLLRANRFLSVLLALLGGILTAQAGPFARIIPFVQPDGTPIQIWGRGDEFHAIFETLDGFSVIYDQARRGYCLARLSADGSTLESTGQLVGQISGARLGLPKHERINPAEVKKQAEARRRKWEADLGLPQRWNRLKSFSTPNAGPAAAGLQAAPPALPTLGTKVGLTLLIDFDTDPATIPQAEIVNFLNGDNYTGFGNNGSVKKYFLDNSNGQLTYSNVVTVYLRIPNTLHPKSWYNDLAKDCGGQGNLLIRDALQILKALPNYQTEILPAFNALSTDDFNRTIACNVFYAGGNGGVWNKGLWPHSWALYNVGEQELSPGGKKVWAYQITDIGGGLALGTFCHENGHMLCDYPDIYDYDYDSEGGAGMFCLMNSGGHGANPAQICAYLKYKSGWATTTELSSNSVVSATVTASAGAGFNHFYRYTKPGAPTEYFLIENRQKSGRDASLPASGIAIWHVDELGDHNNQSLAANANHANYEVTLVQADNRWDFQNNANGGDLTDLYYSGNSAAGYANRFSDTTAPHAHWWNGSASGLSFRDFSAPGATMTFQIAGTGNPSPVIVTPPAAMTAVAGTDVLLAIAAAGQAPLTYQWRRNGANLSNSSHFGGANASTLIISNAQPADMGGYDVIVSNGFGSVTSSPPATLTVYTAPFITSQPQGVVTNAGSEITFAATATGVAPLTYQWRKNLVPISGADGPSYTLAVAWTNDSGSYSVTVTNAFGGTVSSNAALTVIPGISIGEAVDKPSLTWVTSGDAPWTGQDAVSHDGQDAAASGNLTTNQQSSFSTTILGPTNVSFWWKVSSEPSFDFLEFRVNGILRESISGEVNWAQRNFNVPAGAQTLQWTYRKNESYSVGADKGWVDQVTFGPPVILSFPDAVDAPGLTWTSYGGADWEGQTEVTHDGVDAGRSGAIGNSSHTGASLEVVGPGRLNFWWKVSSEPDWDFLEVYIDVNFYDQISGEVDWQPRTLILGAGTHTVDFEYNKDFSDSAGADAGWIDQVVWVADNAPPQIIAQPAGQVVEVGQTASFSVQASGTGALTYRWRKNGSPIGGATGASYSIASTALSDGGNYSVVVSNANGAITSSNALLTVLPPIALGDAVDAPLLAWLTALPGDSAPWKGQAAVTQDGIDAARSGSIADGQRTTIETTVNGSGMVSFWWKVSSETNFDFLYFHVGGIERARVSGEAGWQERAISVPEGTQTLRWFYEKDLSVSAGQDAAWLDRVTFTPTNQPPSIVAARFTNQIFSAAVPTLTGRSYVLEFKTSLNQTNWTALPAINGDGTVRWLTDSTATNAQRFYRIRSP